MRPIWTGSIGFGLINIPVRFYAATEESTLPFISMEKNNHARIRYKKVNEVTGKEVPQPDIVKGYKLGADYVVVEDEDFQKALPEKNDHLEIVQFINEKEIDAVFFEKLYYLEPDKGGAKPYALLREVLKKSATAALSPLVYHKREWICLLKPLDDVMVMHRLRFAEEMRPSSDLTIPKADLKPEELKIAALLIDQLTRPFKPEQFKDEFSDKLLKVIEAKAKGKGGTFKTMKVVHNITIEDLMQKLKASIKPTTRKKHPSPL
jgi:DNA end-binding protein Ku